MPTDLVPIFKIAARFNKSDETVRLWITRGVKVKGIPVKLNGFKVGGSWLVSELDLHIWLTALEEI